MKISNRQKGQTLIETALILSLLLLIVLGIEEFARAWYTKNSIKNAARQGARVAVVTPTAPTTINTTCSGANPPCNSTQSFTNCPSGTGNIADPIINAICNSAGVDRSTTAYVTCFLKGTGTSTTLERGDTVNVCVQTDFTSAIPTNFPGLGNIIPNQLYGDASMRYE